ncbi:MAG: phytanoyl-CoA dioxygenase [Moorea sp. SIO3I7]|uniref:phytanoyl-CoA dioxygenase family protein n=1 Tax=unclassified Moorena TaxID=2683338 RepID=UPI0013C2212F|nr:MULTISPECIES: phytanoyl-CoA dioxygenase family protein [unclassified Moorena]NEN94009.1 phytanoyl-CoA dioxygenase [Moorena sp. SIO3I7]NEO05212.1 phytanoyl-CoA dioxygenase [Moorena sp. SIO3I8]NEO18188.1 phytanoyl-CoA dioxygenase [Moorena sp. SIO4A5]NEP21583.1 phytanoyl-CoA dioxygenase [Moorena sp. SIO3I6]NEQ60442.1 phytanoyl-CoA dioxygenase [Moorena sp. SIO4A1]
MKLTKDQIEQYEEQGFLFISECFSSEEVSAIRAQVPIVVADETLGRAWEEDEETLRTLYGIHLTNRIFRSLVRHPRLLEPAQQLFGRELYVFRSKIVMKSAFTGGMWGWHQDSAFAQHYEKISAPKGGNVILFLDEVNEFNGPIYYIPGSHTQGLLDWDHSVVQSPTASVPLTVDRGTFVKFVEKSGISAPKGPAGSVLFVHYDTLHGSVANISPFERRNFVITYSSLEQSALPKKESPAFFSDPERSPLVLLSEDEANRYLTSKG